jgi:hypothetical protein
VEVYQYEKRHNVFRQKRNYTKSKRTAKKSNDSRPTSKYRTRRSIQRARQGFFRLVAANLREDSLPSFITLTCYDKKTTLADGYSALKFFWQKVRIARPECKYILVPEWQKRGALHFHVLIWGLTPNDVRTERTTRNFQRCWARGFVDIRAAKNSNLAIAGYMAKYLAKALEDTRLANQRAYSCSRNVDRPTTVGTNNGAFLLDVSLPDAKYRTIAKHKIYDTIWLGQCDYIKYNLKQNVETKRKAG